MTWGLLRSTTSSLIARSERIPSLAESQRRPDRSPMHRMTASVHLGAVGHPSHAAPTLMPPPNCLVRPAALIRSRVPATSGAYLGIMASVRKSWAKPNRDLLIGFMRAYACTIPRCDPKTRSREPARCRGHSDRQCTRIVKICGSSMTPSSKSWAAAKAPPTTPQTNT
jgi:hypothetical protein